MSSQLALALAIVSEVIATSVLKASEGFSRPVPTVIVLFFYVLAFYSLSLALKTIPVGIAYAVWSGVGIVMVTIIGWVVYGQKLDAMALFGMGLILVGVLVVNLFSGSAGH
jgi:small multidrug resistance pump